MSITAFSCSQPCYPWLDNFDTSSNKYFTVTKVIAGDTFINAHMIENGYAMIMTVPPNVKYTDMFLKLSQKARKQKKGLWGKE